MTKLALLAALMVVALLAATRDAEAVTCSVVQLSPCASAITSSKPPSPLCCQKLREQKPCLCQYYKNPSLRQYVRSPGAKRVASACRVNVHC